MKESSVSETGMFRPWIIWLAAAVFVIFQQYTGTFYGLTAEQLQKWYAATKGDISLISACFFLTYGLMQIPAGLILDRFNKKLVLSGAAAVAAIGMLTFSFFPAFPMGCLAAILLGIGTSFSFVGAVMLFIKWFPPGQFAFVLGLLGGMGCIGTAVLCTVTTSYVTRISFTVILIALTVFSVVTFVMNFLFVHDPPEAKEVTPHIPPAESDSLLKSLGQVLKNRQNWLAGLFNALLFGPALAFSSFWNFPYQKTYHHGSASAVMINNMVLVGLAIGAPLIGWLSDRIKQRVLPAQLFAVGSLACMILIISDLVFSKMLIFAIMLLYGLFSNATTVGYAFAKEHTEAQNHGTVTGFVNTITFISITALQILPGVFYGNLKTFYAKVYTYDSALLILPFCILGAIAATFFMKETHGRPQC
jgi:nitrate/nitrite transporter NarK